VSNDLTVSKDAEPTTSLGNQPVPMLGHPHVRKAFPDVQRKNPVFEFVPIASCPVTGHH